MPHYKHAPLRHLWNYFPIAPSVLLRPYLHRSTKSSASHLVVALSLATRLATLTSRPFIHSSPQSASQPIERPEPSGIRQTENSCDAHALVEKAHGPIPSTYRNLPSHIPSFSDWAVAQHAWSDLELQFRLSEFQSPLDRELLATVHQKVKGGIGSPFGNHWAKLAAKGNYAALASILCRSNYVRRVDIIHCGDEGGFPCDDRLCPRCSWVQVGLPAVEEFGNAFSADQEVCFVTLSLSSDPEEAHRFIFRDFNGSDMNAVKGGRAADHAGLASFGIPFTTKEDVLQARLVWTLMGEAVREFVRKRTGPVSGAVAAPELAFRLMPLKALPHYHVVCWSPGFSEDDARRLRRSIKQKFENCREFRLRIYPVIACLRIPSPEDLRRILGYIVKAPDFAAAYVSAAEGVSYQPKSMAILNEETNRFLHNFWLVSRHLQRRPLHLGRCHPGHRAYLGHVTERRLKKREREAERRCRAHAHGTRESARPGSAFENWKAFLFSKEASSGKQRSNFAWWRQRREIRRRPWRPPGSTR